MKKTFLFIASIAAALISYFFIWHCLRTNREAVSDSFIPIIFGAGYYVFLKKRKPFILEKIKTVIRRNIEFCLLTISILFSLSVMEGYLRVKGINATYQERTG